MSTSFMTVPIHFTVEFLGFLVMAGGALVVLLRPLLLPGGRTNRWMAALGMTTLAAGQVLHGGAFLDSDGDLAFVLIRTIGFLLLLLGVARSATITAAPAGVTITDPVLVAPSVVALLVAVVSMQRSFRGASRTLRRLSLATFLLALAEALTGLSSRGAFGVGTVDGYAYAAHTVKALGYLAVATWLWAGMRSSIRSRYVASFAALLVIVVLALSSALTGVISSNVQQGELERVKNQAENAAADLSGVEARELTNDALTIALLPTVRDAFRTGQGLRKLASTLTRSEVFEADFTVLMNPRGKVLAFAGKGPQNGSDKRGAFSTAHLLRVQSSPAVTEAAGPVEVTFGLTRLKETLASIAAVDITSRASGATGLLAVGRFIDDRSIEEISARVAPTRASLVVDRRVVATELRRAPARIVPAELNQALIEGNVETSEQVLGGRSYLSAFVPLGEDGKGSTDSVLVMSSPSRIAAETREGVTRILFLVTFGVGLIALALAWLSGLRITRPIQRLTQTAEAVREGDLNARSDIKSDDEVGRLGTTFNEMTASLLSLTGDLREAAAEEQRLRTRIETIMESMADGLVAVGADGKVLAFNPEAERLTGVRADAAIGAAVEQVLVTSTGDGDRSSLILADLQEGVPLEVLLVRPDDEKIPIAITTAFLHDDDDDVVGAVAVLRDITREREVERMKSEFLSNISHELRTPLTPIRGYAEILGRPDVPREKAAKFARGIVDSTARLERIVELLLDFSALEAGRLQPRNRPVPMEQVIGALAEKWSGRSSRHEVVAEVEGALPEVIGDERLLRRSLEEVLDNAIKFSPDGGTIRLAARAEENGRLVPRDRRDDRSPFRSGIELTIADEGIGIAAEDLPKIFSDFHQLDGSATRTYGGLGLGLAFVQRIIEAHSGSVEVESVVDRGTVVKILIPARGATNSRAL